MRIALDYDDTYTADPEFWDWFVINAQMRGHTVTIVTKREPELGVTTYSAISVDRVFTSRQAKSKFFPLEGTIWIDDHPEGIFDDD